MGGLCAAAQALSPKLGIEDVPRHKLTRTGACSNLEALAKRAAQPVPTPLAEAIAYVNRMDVPALCHGARAAELGTFDSPKTTTADETPPSGAEEILQALGVKQ